MELNLFLTPLISRVVGKATDQLIQQFCQMLGMEENRQKLYRHLLAIQEKIADAEMRGAGSAVVQEWMKELRLAAYKAVDVLDDFKYEALRREAIHQQPSSSAKVVKNFFSSDNPVLFRQKTSDKLTKILKKINTIVTEMNTFNFVPRNPISPTDRETYSIVIESDVVGRDGERNEIVNVLLDPQRERDNISVLPIVGMGGLGKTTLAQLVYNHEKVKRHFQLLLWVCVSTEFNIVNIIKSIIQVAQKGVDASASCKEVLQQQLHTILDKKKYLLVLDDVWNNNIEKWEELKTLLFSGVGSGRVIIVTTRDKGVATIMGTLLSHDLASLTEEDSWRLFEKRAFGTRSKAPSEKLVAIGRSIVLKCAGSPLALKTIGGLMGTKPDENDWHIVSEHKLWESLASSGDIFPILKLSYDHLPPYMQQCFAFCAVFPQDYPLERDILIQLWMANDFIPTDGIIDLENKGRHIFNELYRRSFFQDVSEKDNSGGSTITCQMHDLMHDLATKISGMKCSAGLELNNSEIAEVEHIYLPNLELLKFHVLKKSAVIHTLLVEYISEPEKHFCALKSSSLRALKLPLCFSPPKELGYMRHLRYLEIRTMCVTTLPESISNLYNLQTLKLSCYQLRELPKGMRFMSNLRHLFLDGSDYLECMPIGLGQLKYLQTLTKYIVDHDRGVSIVELKNLNLHGHLSLSGLEKIRHVEDVESVTLYEKSNLQSLKLEWGFSRESTGNDQVVLEALRPPLNLKFLNVAHYSGFSFSNWMKNCSIMKNLKTLELEGCINCVELPPLWQLPSLENIFLWRMDNLKSIVCGTYRNFDGSKPLITFPRLKTFTMLYMKNLEGWHERGYELIHFADLNELVINDCPKLMTMPVHTPLLKKLVIYGCSGIMLRQIPILPMLSLLKISMSTVPTETVAFRLPKTLEEMEVRRIENVIPLWEEENETCQENSLHKLHIEESNCFFSSGQARSALGFWKHFVALQSLVIDHCNVLVSWPAEEFRGLNSLKHLSFSYCSNFTGVLPSLSSLTPRGKDFLPKLEKLSINRCPELLEVHTSSKSLNYLYIADCPKLLSLGLAGSTSLTELKSVLFEDCNSNWRALPDNMEHLPSLEYLSLINLQGMESFSEGLKQRLSSLQYLRIQDCPAL